MHRPGDTAFETPLEAFNANLAPIKLQLGIPTRSSRDASSPISTARAYHTSISKPAPRPVQETLSSIRVGARTLPFPSPVKYAEYIDFFFDDVNPCHPGLNEAEFRTRSERLLKNDPIDRSEICFLALNYIIFASVDMLLDVQPVTERGRLAGWHWFLAANELVGKRKASGRGDLCMIQLLMFEVSELLFHICLAYIVLNICSRSI